LYSTLFGYKQASYMTSNLHFIGLSEDESYIIAEITESGGKVRQFSLTWDLTYSGNEHMIVEKVDTVSPTSQQDLCDKLKSLRS
jgi:hypothetical protein